MRKFLRQMLWLLSPPRTETRTVRFDNRGARVAGCESDVWNVVWADVIEVAAWKDDLFGYDSICIGLRTNATGDGFAWACEEDDGYNDFADEVLRRFPPRDTDW